MTRRAAQLALAGLCLLHLGVTFRYHVPLDDSFISFRYAHNLARGNGLVWNLGERVEGYTNFLWTVLVAPFLRLGAEPTVVATIFGTLASLLVVLLTYRLTRVVGAGRAAAIAAATVVAANAPLAFAAGSGMETAAFAATCCGAVVLAVRLIDGQRDSGWAACGLLLAVTSLLRPEGALPFALAVVAAGVRRETRRGAIVLAVAYLAVMIPFVGWRFTYYGDFVPNTAHVKVGFRLAQLTHGVRYLLEWLTATGSALLVLVPFAFRRASPGRLYVGLLALGYCAYVVYVGGDALPMFRFLVPALPWLAALVALGFEAIGQRLGDDSVGDASVSPRVRTVAAIVAVAFAISPSVDPQPHSPWLRFRDKRAEGDGLKKVGHYLARTLPAGSSIATGVIGAIGYYSDLPLIDTFGLTDRHIARTVARGVTHDAFMGHEKGDGAYILARGPDYFLPCELIRVTDQKLTDYPAAVGTVFRFKTEVELWRNPEFHRRYRLVSLPFDEGGYLNLYQKVAP